MADEAMRNYDPQFQRKIHELAATSENVILATGANFGIGSSREQAAKCLRSLGIKAIVAGSLGATYTRNAVNNGLLALECPELVPFLRRNLGVEDEEDLAEDHLSVAAPVESGPLSLDLTSWTASYAGQEFALLPMGAAAQELIVAGGLEPWISAQTVG
eukprot:Plantae.Rhodophyta-Rhodochaete_pulchella.ctg4568.p1 GENE.Plantae.Rhodophyta-Rhodochaete_pulchella.ctg4568~~Plantae.Rhodophyta-Rhodochaete_pulchella.ctg4568.p1  ORF type:complete len:174 (+),score=27.39 Plantae.Rhodophyta-Rhodochaete_pulchella.ctg4568:48-524(+)